MRSRSASSARRRSTADRGARSRTRRSGRDIIVKDVIADAFLQQILLRPDEYDVIATLNLNGDYISDALAAQVGGIGIAPGANLSDTVAMFEATHGTAPKYAGKDYVNPGSEILSAEMMLVHMGWKEAAALITSSLEKAILDKVVTYDFARLMPGATQVSCSGFGTGDDRADVEHPRKVPVAAVLATLCSRKADARPPCGRPCGGPRRTALHPPPFGA